MKTRDERIAAIEAMLARRVGWDLSHAQLAIDIEAALFPKPMLTTIESVVLSIVRRNPGTTIAAVQTEIRAQFGASSADAVRTLRLCKLIELRSGFALYPVTP